MQDQRESLVLHRQWVAGRIQDSMRELVSEGMKLVIEKYQNQKGGNKNGREQRKV